MLGSAEGLLHGPQLPVAEHGFERVELGIGAQHEDAVEPLLLFDLCRVDREVLLANRLQIPAVAGIADQRLVTPLELPLERGDDRGAVSGILCRLLMVAANDITPPGQHHRLGLNNQPACRAC
jgi:hypothetical protein